MNAERSGDRVVVVTAIEVLPPVGDAAIAVVVPAEALWGWPQPVGPEPPGGDAVGVCVNESVTKPPIVRRRRKGSPEAVVVGLAEGRPYTEIARTAHIAERTVRRRAQELEIRDQVEALQALKVERANAIMLESMTPAAEQIRRLALHAEDEAVALRAAALIFNYGAGRRQQADLERRLRRIEEAKRAAEEEEEER